MTRRKRERRNKKKKKEETTRTTTKKLKMRMKLVEKKKVEVISLKEMWANKKTKTKQPLSGIAAVK